jgi:hypothetical protein
MRNLTKILVTVGLGLSLSTSAGAVISIGLVQIGGTYSVAFGGSPGDTLELNITYSLQPGDVVTLIDPALVFDPAVFELIPEFSVETGFAAWSGGAVALNPIATGDIGLVTPGLANGWEKGTTIAGGGTTPCVFGSCTSLGTAWFLFLTSASGETIAIGGVGQPGGTVVGDGTFVDIAGWSNLGSFTIVPEPTTASLLGLGLLGLTASHRRRKH